MRPSEYSTLSLKVALAASIALHLAAFIYASQLPVAAVEAPLEEPFQVVFTLERSAPPAEPEASPASSAEPKPEPVAEADPLPAPEPEPEPEPEPVVEPEPMPEPVEPEPLEEPEPEPTPAPEPEPEPEPQPAAPAKAAPDVEVQKKRPVAENATAEEVPAREPMHLASAPSESTVHEVEQLPRELSAPPPRYPVAQLRRGVEDAVRVRLLIDEEGRVEDVEFLAGSLPFRKAIEAVVYRWRFEPATADGRPVKIWGTKTVQFALNSN